MKKPLLSTSVEIFEVAVVRDKILNPEYFNSYAASHLAETKPYGYILADLPSHLDFPISYFQLQ